jgi:hypothetical protein
MIELLASRRREFREALHGNVALMRRALESSLTLPKPVLQPSAQAIKKGSEDMPNLLGLAN